MNSIEELIETVSHDMLNPEHNFNIAIKYEQLGQTASAVSFYLRAAEYGYKSHPEIVYASLLRMSHCFEEQSGREHTVSNVILQAIQYLPNRPEAYFLMSRFYERSQKWQESYTFAEIGLMFDQNIDKLPVDVDFPGRYALLFEKAVSGWWIGREDESLMIFTLLLEEDIREDYKNTIKYNLEKLGIHATV
jgi:tetratricopeptide (TPR) repeat protein